jgi:transcriptional regulator with XRE-family HTH domain
MASRSRERELASELDIARVVAGLTQRGLANRLGMSQSKICRLLNGTATLHVDVADAIARACGHRLRLQVLTGNGIGLRDSGQLGVARAIEREAHDSWQARLEVPVAAAPDRRAVDLVLVRIDEVVAIEIERWLRDFHAQLRAAQLKRLALSERLGGPVRLVLAIPDTVAARRRLQPFVELVARELPISSRTAWARIRSGQPVSGDALLWVRA